MIKKFVSNALLSVVMDKDARKKLQSMRAAELSNSSSEKSLPDKSNAGNSVPETSARSRNRPLPDDTSGEGVIETIAQALAEARAEVGKGPRPKVGAGQHPGAARNLRDTPSPAAPIPSPPRPSSPPATAQRRTPAQTPERERLIQEALSIQRQKSHVLEELDPATREKLMVMAQYVMDPSSLPKSVREQAKTDARSEGLVDNPGGKSGSLRKKPLPPRT